MPCVNSSYMQFNHYYVHILLSHTLTPYFYLSTIHLLSAKPLVASYLDIENPFSNYMDPYCSCLYSIITFNWNTTLLPCLHVITQVIFVILSLLVEPILFLLNNDLHCFHLPAVSGLICLPRPFINSSMC